MSKTMNYIKKELNDRGWTKAEFAKKLGVSEVTVGRWLNGTRTPKITDVENMFVILGCQFILYPLRKDFVQMQIDKNNERRLKRNEKRTRSKNE